MNFKPHDYQSYAIEYIENHPVSAVLLDMGLGKTVISLTAIADLLFDSFLAHRILVIAPLRVARDTWPAELKKWSHLKHLTFAVAVGTPAERKAALMAGADITIINRENVVLTVIGALAGLVLGVFLTSFIVHTVEVDIVMFGRDIMPQSFLYALGLTFLFAIIVNFFMYFKMKKIDMVESLKSIE